MRRYTRKQRGRKKERTEREREGEAVESITDV